MTGRGLWAWCAQAFTAAAIGAVLGFIVTGSWTLGALAVLLVLAACGALWLCLEDVDALDLDAPEPHPLDPYPEQLRRRLALGELEDGDRTARRGRAP